MNPASSNSATNTSDTKPEQILAKSTHDNTLADPSSSPREQNPNKSLHKHDKSVHSKRVPEEYQNLPEDLARVATAWDGLPDPVKAEILAIVNSAQQKDG